jgi:tRNA dimethylallyltransferase
MDIGTAKPSLADRQRVPHHLIDIAEPDQILSLAVFQKAAWGVIEDIHQRRKLPFLVGGTGQYIHAVIETWEIPPVMPDPRLRNELEKWAEEIGALGLHNRLAILDPLAAEKIDWRNQRRTIRALEVILSSGIAFSAQRKRAGQHFELLQVGLHLPRPELYSRIDARVQHMVQAGLVEEVRALLNKGYTPDLPTMSAIGYREIISYLQGEISLDEAVARMKHKTRVLVRRQANWFRQDDASIHWFSADEMAVGAIKNLLHPWLHVESERV